MRLSEAAARAYLDAACPFCRIRLDVTGPTAVGLTMSIWRHHISTAHPDEID